MKSGAAKRKTPDQKGKHKMWLGQRWHTAAVKAEARRRRGRNDHGPSLQGTMGGKGR